MPISMNCPQCDEPYNLADRQLGKKVRCKTCEYVFTVEEPKSKAGIKAGGPGPRLSATAKPRRGRDDEDDFDDREERPRRKAKQKSSAGKWVLLTLLLLLGLGGIGVGVWLIVRDDDDSGETKKTEKTVAGALEKLKSPEVATRREGLEWLAEIEPDEAHAKEVLEAIIKAAFQDPDPKGQELVKKATEKWAKAMVASAGKNPLGGGNNPLGGRDKPLGGNKDKPMDGDRPSLGKEKPAKDRPTEELLTVLNADNTPGHVRKEVMDELVKRKEAKAAPGIAKRLPNFFERGDATNALRNLGKVAETEVLAYMHHPDGGCADSARSLLDGYGTTTEVKLEQTAKDLDSSDGNRRRVALEWLGKQRPGKLPPQAAEVAQGLEKMLSDPFQKENAMRALVAWGSKANVPAVARAVQGSFGFGGFESLGCEFLAKYPDAQGVAAIVHHINNGSPEIEKALRGMGPVAESEVAKLLNDPDDRKRDLARRLLKGYNTKVDVLLPQVIEDLRSADGKRRSNAAGWLAITAKPAESPHFTAVAQGLEAALGMRGAFEKPDTFHRAIVAWATKESVPVLVRLLADDLPVGGGRNPRPKAEFPLAPEAMMTLANLKDERAVDILIVQLLHRTADATAALKAMGPIAEKKVLGLLNNRIAAVRHVGCDILKDIGGKDSVERLTKLSKTDRVAAVKNAAKDALDAVNQRVGVKPPDAKQPDK
jgi:hypothetical protein